MAKLAKYGVHPLWVFLRKEFGMDEAFKLFGPYKGANIIPKQIDNFTYKVSMDLTLNNTNYVGTHFGGSLYSMCDPFFMFILMQNLGETYMVWDKSAKIDFLKPGTGMVQAIFYIPQDEIEEIKKIVEKEKKTTRFYEVEVKDEKEMVIARVTKELYIRRLNDSM